MSFRLFNNRSLFDRYTLLTNVVGDIARDNLFLEQVGRNLNSTIDYFGYSVNTHSGFLDIFSYSGLIGLISFCF